jgi:hypothetical protein
MGKANISLEMKRKRKGVVYSITLHGHGSVVFKSGNHVKMKDISDIPIKKKDFINLLTDFENFPFPDEKAVYQVDENSKDDYTFVSFSIKHGDGDFEEKEIIHYNNDEKVSQKIKNLEDKVDELTKSKQWLKSLQPTNEKKKDKILSVKKTAHKTKIRDVVDTKKSFSFLDRLKISPKILKILVICIIAIFVVSVLFVFIPDLIDKEVENVTVDISVSNSSGYSPLMVNFDSSFSNFVGDVEYFWDFGDGVNSSVKTTSHTYLESGVYTVTLKVTDSKGNSASDSIKISVD